MVGRILKYGTLFFLLMLGFRPAAAQYLWSKVELNKSSVYVGEPVEVSVTVYTSTWFTKGVDPGNVKVNGAYTLYFRGVSQSTNINGKHYAGVQMLFNVFPYDEDDLVFPSLDIKAETPAEGGYQGKKHVIKTKARKIKVKPVPKNYDKSLWMVATNMDVAEQWTGNRNHVKIGDVLERRITRSVNGTVSGLIAPIHWDPVPHVSMYPERPVVEDIKTKTSIKAKRTDGIRYLFEKEGEHTLPSIVIQWWNPVQRKLYKRTLKEVKIHVLPNPDLGMLVSVRDSLDALNAVTSTEIGKEKNFFQRLTKKQKTLLVILTFLVIYLLKKIDKIYLIINWLIAFFKKKWQTYFQSEKYYFHQFVKAAKTKDNTQNLNAAYRWIDNLNLAEPTLSYFAKQSANEIVIKEAALLIATTDKPGKKVTVTIRRWALARKRFLNQRFGGNCDAKKEWINPPDNCL